MIKKVVAVAAVTGGLLFAGAGAAVADGAEAEGTAKGSPGVVSGNNIQVPVDLGLNVCGNTINVIGLLNPALGNVCVND